MATILCPTRGGEASTPNQRLAIKMAVEQGVSLVFLYVSNVHFLDRLPTPWVADLEEQLDEIGEFVLAMAQERAEKAGVTAGAEVRRGEFRQALMDVIDKHQVTTVVLGSAEAGTGITTPEYLEELTKSLLEEFDIEILIVSTGKVIVHHKPAEGDPHQGTR